MRPTFDTPRSVAGIKSRASEMRKKDPSCKSIQALEQVSKQAGFSNWTHAQRALPKSMKQVILTAHWYDENARAKGSETISYPLPWTAIQIVEMNLKVGHASCLNLGTVDANDLCLTGASNQEMARYWLVRALRELMFMEATGFVRRSNTVRAWPHHIQTWSGGRFFEADRIPATDHCSTWQDPKTKAYLILDEPYLNGLPHRNEQMRQEWCERVGYRKLQSAWGGTWMPGRTTMFMICHGDKGIDLNAIEEQLGRMPDDFSLDDWKGTSQVQQF
jgi:hypothetical protein